MHDDCLPKEKQSNQELLADVKDHLVTLYWRRISDRVTASIGLLRTEAKRSQFLCLFIEDEQTGMWINLRLSTVRRIIKFLDSKQFLKARRLDELEKLLLGK